MTCNVHHYRGRWWTCRLDHNHDGHHVYRAVRR